MDPKLEVMLQYGAVGVILVVVLRLFLWAFKQLFQHFLNQQKSNSQSLLEQQRKTAEFMDEVLKHLIEIQKSIVSTNSKLIEEIKEITENSSKLVIRELQHTTKPRHRTG